MGFFKKKIRDPFIKFLKQGGSPRQLATCIALGVVFGLIPVYGFTTAILTLIAIIFGLNVVVIQAAHYAVMPIQLLLIIPFFKLGQWVFGQHLIPFSLREIRELMKADIFGFLSDFGLACLYALIVWIAVSIPLYFIIYYGSMPYLKKVVKAYQQRKADKESDEDEAGSGE